MLETDAYKVAIGNIEVLDGLLNSFMEKAKDNPRRKYEEVVKTFKDKLYNLSIGSNLPCIYDVLESNHERACDKMCVQCWLDYPSINPKEQK